MAGKHLEPSPSTPESTSAAVRPFSTADQNPTGDTPATGTATPPTSAEHGLLTAHLPREVDAANEAVVRLDLLSVLDAYAPRVSGLIVDMENTRFIDSSGLRALLVAEARSDELSVPMCIVAPSHDVRRFLNLVDIAGRIPVFDNVDAALTAFSSSLEPVAAAR